MRDFKKVKRVVNSPRATSVREIVGQTVEGRAKG